MLWHWPASFVCVLCVFFCVLPRVIYWAFAAVGTPHSGTLTHSLFRCLYFSPHFYRLAILPLSLHTHQTLFLPLLPSLISFYPWQTPFFFIVSLFSLSSPLSHSFLQISYFSPSLHNHQTFFPSILHTKLLLFSHFIPSSSNSLNLSLLTSNCFSFHIFLCSLFYCPFLADQTVSLLVVPSPETLYFSPFISPFSSFLASTDSYHCTLLVKSIYKPHAFLQLLMHWLVTQGVAKYGSPIGDV